MRILVLFIVTLLISGCACTKWAPPPENTPAKAMMTQEAQEALDPPPLLTVAMWLAWYGQDVIPKGERWTAECYYPTYGTPVDKFVWQFEVFTDGLNLPPDVVGCQTNSTRFWCPPEQQDEFRVRVAGIDSLGRQGPFSPYLTFADTVQAECPHIQPQSAEGRRKWLN